MKIDRLYAFIVENGPDDEAVISGNVMYEDSPEVMRLPLVLYERDRIPGIRPHAQYAADQMGKTVRLAMFTVRTDVETLTPHGGERNGH